MHVTVREAAAGGDVEVPDDLVHLDNTLQTTTFLPLCLESSCVTFSFALFDIPAVSETPLFQRVCFSDLLAGGTAAGLDSVRGCGSSSALAAIFRIEMRCTVFLRVAVLGEDVSIDLE